ncbi:mitochondrial transcription rescue factor 1 [Anthonomus grandis grandis]|uniref:mitochondrial transcription rescue factor 1 n=1 Tax=Anthonomus grandis grandis TaxID=2921223 RepID=UPI002165A6A0|nr:mitochondrial transcription rescue factor 1 [Anthonomus grandis grandis]
MMLRPYIKLGTLFGLNKTLFSGTYSVLFSQKYLTQRTLLTNAPVASKPLFKNTPKIPQNSQSFLILRNASNTSKRKGQNESESESSTSENEDIQDKNTKVLKISVNSLRIDAILRSALGLARNKIEMAFYENRIRVNGQKISKKSATVQEGDEVDLIKGPDLKNPNFIYVARVEVLSVKAGEESISVKVKRCKSLLVDAYE